MAQSNANKNSTDAPMGANGAAPNRDVGSSPNAGATSSSTTTSSSMLEQKNKKDSTAGAPASGSNTKP